MDQKVYTYLIDEFEVVLNDTKKWRRGPFLMQRDIINGDLILLWSAVGIIYLILISKCIFVLRYKRNEKKSEVITPTERNWLRQFRSVGNTRRL